MTYLQLVARLHVECRAAGPAPTSVLNQTGQALDFVHWIDDAWTQLQAEHQAWKFLRLSTSFVTINGQATYTPVEAGLTVDTLGLWIKDSFRSYLTAGGINGEMPMGYRDYEAWRNLYQLGALRVSLSQPTEITITPNSGLGLGPVPLGGYTINGDYYRAPVRLVNDADVLALPARHDPMIVVYKAMVDYAYTLAASEVLARAERKLSTLKNWLEIDQLPAVSMQGALA